MRLAVHGLWECTSWSGSSAVRARYGSGLVRAEGVEEVGVAIVERELASGLHRISTLRHLIVMHAGCWAQQFQYGSWRGRQLRNQRLRLTTASDVPRA